ncbi:unnamed protein product [Allacma fusca]|uniref:Uncharacterized protein n=1 Tax=Allacma fusca TaxID=39272 RepID=A0A8J2K7E9_9HEXA|nr:unnamed protein product [Allacma fusca]
MVPIILILTCISAAMGQRLQPGLPETLLPGQPGLLRNGLNPSAGAVTLHKSSENLGDGNFRWEFETSDGTRAEQTGFLKNPDPINEEGTQVITGSYSYISPEGIPITVSYIADENGFQPIGDHIPGNNLRRNVLPGAQRGPFGAGPLIQPLPTADPSILRNPRPENPIIAQELLLNNAGFPNRFNGGLDPYNVNGLNRFNPYGNRVNQPQGPFNNRGFPFGFGNRFVQ